MVLLGGLEFVAAGYLIHKHNKNKREKELLREELAQAEEELEKEEEREERRERHRRRKERERREREKWEAEHPYDVRPARTNSAPPSKGHAHPHSPAMIPVPIVTGPVQTQQPNPAGPAFPPTGWPANWKQAHTPPTPPPIQSTTNLNPNTASGSGPGSSAGAGAYGYPPDIKYGFIPEIPHDSYPSYPPPPFSPGPQSPGPSGREGNGRGRRTQTLDVNENRTGHRRRHRRSASPRIGVVDEFDDRSSTTSVNVAGRDAGRENGNGRVRFSTEDVVLSESARSPPPSYSSLSGRSRRV